DDLESVRKELKQEIQTLYDEVQELREDLRLNRKITAQNTYDIAKLKFIKNEQKIRFQG
ncbi:MAG: hypothetical protein GX053_13460, partial [Tissierella sp.]|nr:hypothetical protein [Tissierella sp.]